ncbi:MAG: hydrogenase maturation protease [Synechococcaceae bacterium WB6_3B_236]|nr:hydrogenase maturation protease [Synechococcaceae bacterium WB6_3B_236]
MEQALVIGFGNSLRGDDGVGLHLAALANKISGASVRAVAQLTPELAPELAAANRVLFIDAWQQAGATPQLQRLQPDGQVAAFSHQLNPLQLLALGSALYGGQPIAHQLLVPASSMELGAGFSAGLLAQLPEAERLLRQWLHPGPPCTN